MTASPALLLARLAARADVSGPDADLLARFRRGRDEAAFAELVRRHGPAVFRVCRRLVGPAAADDAFQATFLVLATRADSVKSPGAVGPYLVGVAGRVARQMRTARLRRHAHEAAFAADPLRPTSDTPASLDLAEEARLLDEELTRLPDRLRGPLVLCMVEGRTHDQAAADLGGSPRTVRRQLVEAKRLLRLRLERRGVVPAVAAALAAGAGGGAAAVPVGLGPRTVAAVFDFLAGGVATTAVPGVVAKGVVTAMIARKLALVLTAAAVGLTAVGVGVGGAGDGPGPAKPADGPPAATTGPAKPGSSVAASDNFAVTAPTLEAAQTILSAAEGLRKRVALDWTGADLPVWETPCLVRYSPTGATPAGTLNGNPPIYYEESIARPERTDFAGATYVRFPPPAGRPGVRALDIVLSGDLPKVVAEPLPRQVRAAVLATVVGRPVPTWTGWVFPHLGEQPWPDDPDHIRRVQRAKSDGHLLTVRQLLGVRKPPTGMAADEARGTADQATSLAHFLLSRGPTGASAIPPVQAARRKLVRFVTAGVRDGWDQAANDVYGFWTVERLEEAWLASLGDPVPPDTTAAASGTHDTANFTVTAPTPELAREVGTAAERFWAELSAAWLGTDPATWPRRAPTRPRLWVIKADYGPGVGPHSGTEVAVDKDGDNAIMIRVGSNRRDELFNDLLPAQLTQAVLAAYVGRKIPHWLARGAGTLAMTAEAQADADHRSRHSITHQRLPLRSLFAGTGPADLKDMFAFHAALDHGRSLVRFLVAQRGRKDFTRFLALGTADGVDNWGAAVKEVYGFESIDALEKAWLDSLEKADPTPTPPTPTPPLKVGTAVDKFVVSTGSPAVTRAVRAEAVYQWATAGRRWFGADAKPAPSAGLTIKYVPNGSFHWTADIRYADGRPTTFPFEVGGPLDAALDREIPFVVTYALLADHLGEGRPAWAVHGLGLLAQSVRYQAEQDRDCRELLRKGNAVRLLALFAGGTELFTATNNDTQSQEHAVCRFLLTLRPEADLIRFAKLGTAGKDWNAATRAVYGVADADALEAAWLRWMASPGSRLAAPAAPTPAPAPAGSPRIPPTAVDVHGS